MRACRQFRIFVLSVDELPVWFGVFATFGDEQNNRQRDKRDNDSTRQYDEGG